MKILIVDDDFDFRSALRESFEAEGVFVAEASNGKEGLLVMQKQNFDFVLSDIEMPVMGGIDFLKESRQNFPKVPFILMSGNLDLPLKAYIKLGALDAFEKQKINSRIILAKFNAS